MLCWFAEIVRLAARLHPPPSFFGIAKAPFGAYVRIEGFWPSRSRFEARPAFSAARFSPRLQSWVRGWQLFPFEGSMWHRSS
jgi:hypothetical protein